MPLILKFKPKKDDINKNSREVNDFPALILQLKSIVHQGASVSIRSDNEGSIIFIELTIRGITVIDVESSNMLASVISERLREADSPFYLAEHSRFAQAEPGEALFLHERFKPISTVNSRDISKIDGLDVPEKFCCSIGGLLMDRPVYDIRSPHIVYDYDFLMYWLNKSHPKLMPHTKLPFDISFIKVDRMLQLEIINFVKTAIELHEKDRLEKILLKYDCKFEDKKMSINHALLKSAECGDSAVVCDELSLLLKFSADINFQEPVTRETALHKALRRIEYGYVISLLYCGAKIDIQDCRGDSAFDLIRSVKEGDDKDSLLYIGNLLGLLVVSPDGECVLPGRAPVKPVFVRNMIGSPVTAAGDAHTLLLQKINAVLEGDVNRSDLAPFEQSIRDRSYSQALRRACTVVDVKKVFLAVEIILEFKDKLNININEQSGPKKFSALHYAATKAAVSKDRSLYDLLVKHGADENLRDAEGVTASQYLSSVHSLGR